LSDCYGVGVEVVGVAVDDGDVLADGELLADGVGLADVGDGVGVGDGLGLLVGFGCPVVGDAVVGCGTTVLGDGDGVPVLAVTCEGVTAGEDRWPTVLPVSRLA
jgi:hypothetical protein